MKPSSPQRVWDLPVRLFHWGLVILVTLSWISGEFGGLDISLAVPERLFGKTSLYITNMDVHAFLGQAVLILVLFRILWGFWGSTTARFASFVRGVPAIKAEIFALFKGRVPETRGHNPVGALMVVALLALLAAQVVTGLFSADDFFFEGPLVPLVSSETSELLSRLHEQIFGFLQLLILLHIVAVFYYLLRGQNLIKAMVTGKKPVVAELEKARGAVFAPWWKALATFAVAAIAVYFMVNL